MGFEKNLEKLESIVRQLEEKSLSIDDSLKLYDEAVVHAGKCIAEIKESRGKLEILNSELEKIGEDDE